VQPLPHHVICWQKNLRHLAIGGDNFDEWEINRMEYLGTLKTLVLEDPEDDYYLAPVEKKIGKLIPSLSLRTFGGHTCVPTHHCTRSLL